MVDLGDDEGVFDRLSGMFWDRFFPVIIVKRNDYLIIEDRRIAGNMLWPAIGISLIVVILAILFTQIVSSTIGFLLFALTAALVGLFSVQVLSYFLRQTIVFYKDKDLYEIISHGLFKPERETGVISDIKEIKISLNYHSSDGERQLTSTSKLIPKDLILNDLRIQNLERNTLNNNYRTTAEIVFAISDFLDLPYSEEENESY